MSDPTLRLCDVSNWQGSSIDWSVVKSDGFAGAICKASEGIDYADPSLPHNWAGLAAQQMHRGAYCFSRPDQGHSAEQEVAYFLGAVQDAGNLSPNDVVVLDLEVGSGDLSAWAVSWLAAAEAAIGFAPWLYSYESFITDHLTGAALSAYPLWLADYQQVMPPVPPPFTGRGMAAWQYTDSLYIAGIGRCDADIFYGDASAWQRLSKPSPTPPPPPPPPPPPASHYKVTVAAGMYLRRVPRLGGPFGPFLHAGDILTPAHFPDGESITTHWIYCTTAAHVAGWAFRPNLQPFP